jgi:predicted nuclease of predicted toxin-antitoxin system
MKFIVDESTGPAVAKWLAGLGYEIFSVHNQLRGADDETILKKAIEEEWVLITNDKDFGEMVYRQGLLHHGIILMRLVDERSANKIKILQKLLAQFADLIIDSFVVVTESNVRITKKHE